MRKIRLDTRFGLVFYRFMAMTCRCQQPAGQKLYPNRSESPPVQKNEVSEIHYLAPLKLFCTVRMDLGNLGNVTFVVVLQCSGNVTGVIVSVFTECA